MNRDLLLAILAMDAYNRGYGAGIKLDSGTLGKANLIDPISLGIDDEKYKVWQDAGFYAIAYEYNGETIISYRGTNFKVNWSPSTFLDSPIIKDAVNGWSVGGGIAGAQAGL